LFLVYNKNMIENILGNVTAEKVLLSLLHYGQGYTRAIAQDFNIAETPVRKQLERFEDAGVIHSKLIGRTRLYTFNKKSPYTKPLMSLLEVAYKAIPLKKREKIFSTRRRPRRKGKPVL